MDPVANNANLHVDPKRTKDDENDEGFVSPSVQRKERANNTESVDTEESNSSSEESNIRHSGASNLAKISSLSKDVDSKAESLAKFVVYTLLGKNSGNTVDKVERTLLRCVKLIMQKHEILLKGMMKRLQLTRETAYPSFETIANTLFEDEKQIITWSRIITLFAFGSQMALYFKENNMEDLSETLAHLWIGKYTKEKLSTHIASIGGWGKICEEFPEDSDIENKVKRVLSWTAVGLGVAATLFHLTSR